MSSRAKEAMERLKAGDSYAEICVAMQIRPRWLRRLLKSAGVRRRLGRPAAHPQGNRVSLVAACAA